MTILVATIMLHFTDRLIFTLLYNYAVELSGYSRIEKSADLQKVQFSAWRATKSYVKIKVKIMFERKILQHFLHAWLQMHSA